MTKFVVAAAQATPVFLDRDRTIDKACNLIAEAASQGAALVLFPEAFVPAYPVWVWFIPAGGHTRELRELYAELHAQSITIPGPATSKLCDAAAAANIAVAIGINERNSESSDSSLYNTLLYIGPDGRIMGRHRKLVPTSAERMIWAQGDGSDLAVHEFPFARVGGLICWENYMAPARYVLASWGEQIHLAPTWDRGEPWISSMRHIAKENRCYVINCCQALHRDHIPERFAFRSDWLGSSGWLNPGLSLIADPDGKIIAGPAAETETILYAEVDIDLIVGSRSQLDVAGHYARPDVFDVRVRRQERPVVRETQLDEAELST